MIRKTCDVQLRPFSFRESAKRSTHARAMNDAALAIARACPGDMAIEIREMTGYT
jgi:hypothetical protein